MRPLSQYAFIKGESFSTMNFLFFGVNPPQTCNPPFGMNAELATSVRLQRSDANPNKKNTVLCGLHKEVQGNDVKS